MTGAREQDAASQRAFEVTMKEFDRLRTEMDSRTQLSSTIIALDLTALGAGISVFTKVPDVLVGLAAVSSFLWLLWLDHTEQIYKAAAYIGLRLMPRLQSEGDELLGWERFLRAIDAGGDEAYGELFGRRKARDEAEWVVRPTKHISRYVMFLFGGGPIVLLTIYSATLFTKYDLGAGGQVPRLVAVALALALWGFAVRQYQLSRRSVANVNRALLAARSRTSH